LPFRNRKSNTGEIPGFGAGVQRSTAVPRTECIGSPRCAVIPRGRLISPSEHSPSGTGGYYIFDREPVSAIGLPRRAGVIRVHVITRSPGYVVARSTATKQSLRDLRIRGGRAGRHLSLLRPQCSIRGPSPSLESGTCGDRFASLAMAVLSALSVHL
jgi:hypothetical protein